MKEETKEKAESFIGKLKGALDRGFTASKKALGIAGDAVHDFSDKSALRIEKKQLEMKLKKQYEAVGEYTAESLLSKKNASVTQKDSKISEFLEEISRLKREIEARTNILNDAQSAPDESAADVSDAEVKEADESKSSKSSMAASSARGKPAAKKTATSRAKTVSDEAAPKAKKAPVKKTSAASRKPKSAGTAKESGAASEKREKTEKKVKKTATCKD